MNLFLKILLLVLLTSFVGCSAIINQARMNAAREETLLKAGFKPFPITTPQQEKQFEKLRPGKITTIQHNGKIYFIYPDTAHHQLLIGRNKQFMHYNQLVTDQLAMPEKRSKQLEREWEESGVWNNMNGWGSVALDDPFFLPY